MLFVVATPIGNLADLSPRALDTLRSAAIIAAEDTRHTRALLTHFGVHGKHLVALHAHSSPDTIDNLIERLRDGVSIALVTDAGTPTVSDPGQALISRARALGIRVIPLPGPSALLAALAASGLGDGRFRFFGFLPREGAARRTALGDIAGTPETVVLFEAANRLAGTLRELADASPSRPACIARELTKLHEELLHGSLLDLAALDREWLGEVVVVLGPHVPEERLEAIDDNALDARIDGEPSVHVRTLADRLAAWSGRPKRDVYERIVGRRKR